MPRVRGKQLLEFGTLFRSYINGFRVIQTGSSTVSVKAGACLDSTNILLIDKSSATTVDLTISGAGGLDTGSFAANTWYFIHVIKGSSGVSALGSTSATSPTLPVGYTSGFRHVGQFKSKTGPVLINSSGAYGEGQMRFVEYSDPPADTSVLSGGTSTTFAAVSLASYVPVTSNRALLMYDLAITAGTGVKRALLRTTGTGSGAGAWMTASNAYQRSASEVAIMTDSSQSIDYKLEDLIATPTADLDLFVKGYWFSVSPL